MYKNEFVDAVQSRCDVENKETVRKVIDAACEIIKEQVAAGEDVRLLEFGRFGSTASSARTIVGFNGKKVKVPARKVIHFYPSQKFKDTVNPKKKSKSRKTTKKIEG